ncbi:hypothetical protein DXN05_16100 [Deminuibacter soli]|uniref:Uncharacterized protein n=1 Tax=Deminuibacter soli TaxID=2291815 RepID=A0A3E1NGJ8_9BACT|nr:hypothetical protein DXN05_16100 [Deminuibacter soli]
MRRPAVLVLPKHSWLPQLSKRGFLSRAFGDMILKSVAVADHGYRRDFFFLFTSLIFASISVIAPSW